MELKKIISIINNIPKTSSYKHLYDTLKANKEFFPDSTILPIWEQISQLQFNPSIKKNPFKHTLSQNDLIHLEGCVPHIHHPDILWIISDLLWVEKRVPVLSIKALEALLFSLENQNWNEPILLDIIKRLERFKILCSQLSKLDDKKRILLKLKFLFEKLIKEMPQNVEPLYLLHILLNFNSKKCDLNIESLIPLLKKAIKICIQRSLWRTSINHAEGLFYLYKKIKEKDLSEQTALEIVELTLQKITISSKNEHFLLCKRAVFYLNAIHSTNLVEKRNILEEKVLKIRQQLNSESVRIEIPYIKEQRIINRSPLQAELKKTTNSKQVFYLLINRLQYENKEILRSKAQEKLDNPFPDDSLTGIFIGLAESFFPKIIVDKKGKQKKTILSPEDRLALKTHEQFLIEVDTKGMTVKDGIEYLLKKYCPKTDEFPLQITNIYIPVGNELCVYEALLQGLYGQFFQFSNCIIGQIYATFKKILNNNSIEVDESERDSPLQTLITKAAENKILEKDFCFEFLQLLTKADDGYNIRGGCYHGNMENEVYEYSRFYYFWFLCVKFFCFPETVFLSYTIPKDLSIFMSNLIDESHFERDKTEHLIQWLQKIRHKGMFVNQALQWVIKNYSLNTSSIKITNSYVPIGYEQSIYKALLDGLRGKFFSFINCIFGQLEATFKNILEKNNILTSYLTFDGNEEDNTLTPLLEILEEKQIITKEFCQEISKMLTKIGINIRYKSCYGKLKYSEYFAPESCYLWLLCMQFFCFPEKLFISDHYNKN